MQGLLAAVSCVISVLMMYQHASMCMYIERKNTCKQTPVQCSSSPSLCFSQIEPCKYAHLCVCTSIVCVNMYIKAKTNTNLLGVAALEPLFEPN